MSPVLPSPRRSRTASHRSNPASSLGIVTNLRDSATGALPIPPCVGVKIGDRMLDWTTARGAEQLLFIEFSDNLPLTEVAL
jgi:hypothetical protein